jgi:serine/threonine protein phosphatase 1
VIADLLGLRRRQPTAAVPEGLRIYAVGDIHGRLDLLDRLHAMMEADAADAGSLERHIVYLGDFVDRGMDSAGVVQRLIDGPPRGFSASHLKGNHEDAMLAFLAGETDGEQWLQFGGVATLHSYGVPAGVSGTPQEKVTFLRDALRACLPPAHKRFLEGLDVAVTVGDYFFVHAGIRPGVPMEDQDDDDLLWIRSEFLASAADHGKVVVHGHSITRRPEVRWNRIGIDTGAFASGCLTCLVLEGSQRRFIAT